MRAEVIIALIMLFSFFVLDWFEAGPLLSIKGYNVVSRLTRVREAFNGSSDSSDLYFYYGLYVIPLTSLIGLVQSYLGRREEAFHNIAAGGVIATGIMFIQTAMKDFETLELFGPGVWLVALTTVATFFVASDFRKKKKAAQAESADGNKSDSAPLTEREGESR